MYNFQTRDEFEVKYRRIINKKTRESLHAYGVSEIVNTHNREAREAELARLRNRIGNDRLRSNHRKASERGEELHRIMQQYFLNQEKGLSLPPYPMLTSLQSFLSKIDSVIAQEFFLTGEIIPGLQVFGFADILFKSTKGEIVIADWKTADYEKKHLARSLLQISAYAYLLWVHHGIKVDKAFIAIAMTTGKRAQVIRLDQDQLANWIQAFKALAVRLSTVSPL